jgi:hypothetical protein
LNGTISAAAKINLVRITAVAVTDVTLSVDLEDGRTIAVPIGWYPRLAHGRPEERENFQISGAGYGIHWPDLDEDIGVEGLMLGQKSMESPASFAKWLEQRNQATT